MLFGIGWTAFSSIFVFAGFFIFWTEMKTHTWDQVPCEVQEFSILEDADEDFPFKVDLAYRYRIEGRWYTSRQLKPDFEGEESYRELAELEDEIVSLVDPVCWVNPEDPSEAVLFADGGDSWGGLIFMAFGGGFVLIGIGLTVSAVRGPGAKKAVTENADGEGGMGKLLGCGFFGVFAAAGVGMLCGLVLPKAWQYFAVKTWEEVPAEVIWSRVRQKSGDDGPTYRADIFYRYQFEGREYRSNRVNLMGTGGSSGRGKKQDKVDAHPAGTPVMCYVNPRNPHQAMLDRGIGWWALFALFPLPFAAIGLGGLYATFVRRKDDGKGSKAKTEGVTPLRVDQDGTSRKRKKSPVAKRWLNVLGALFVMLFWNGIVSVFVYHLWKGWSSGGSPWFLTLFMTPFAVIGIGMVIHFFYRIATLFSPIYHLELGQSVIEAGDRTSVSWRRRGGGGRPRRLSLWLVGREEATYQRGTNTTTSTELFHESQLFETEVRQMMPAGRCSLDVPVEAVPTFEGENNRLLWFVVVVADVPGRPDVRDEYEITIVAQGGGGS